MDKGVLVQYCEMREEIKDIRRRREGLKRELDRLGREVVSDTVKGTRRDGTYGPIKVTGIRMERYYERKAALGINDALLDQKEIELLQLQAKVEQYIEGIPKSELRIMFRLYYIDGLTWEMVAMRMNHIFPRRRIAYTKDSCRMRNERFLEKF